jgi:hypothetical protein
MLFFLGNSDKTERRLLSLIEKFSNVLKTTEKPLLFSKLVL